MASKILTEQEVYNIGKNGTPTANLLCTKARAIELGCNVIEPSSATDNQLITGAKADPRYTISLYPRTYNGEHQIIAEYTKIEGASKYYLCITTQNVKPTEASSDGVDWTDGTNPAASASEVKTYYIWYRIVGDANHNDVPITYKGSVTISSASSTLTFKNESSTYAITLQYKAYYDGAYHEIATIGAGPQTSNTFTLQTKGTWTLYLSDAHTINTNTGKYTAASVANSVYGWGNKVIVVSSSNGYSVSIGVDSGSS